MEHGLRLLHQSGMQQLLTARRPLLIALLAACASGCAHGPRAMNLLGRVAVLDDGDEPSLDAASRKEAKFPAWFKRLVKSVDGAWHPDVAYLRHEAAPPTGQRAIVARVELAGDGAIANLTVLRSSGSTYLDEDALASLRKAAPFKRPPQGLADGDGAIRFNFGFLFELSRR